MSNALIMETPPEGTLSGGVSFLRIFFFFLHKLDDRKELVYLKKIKWKLLIFCLIIPLAVGGVSGFLIKNDVNSYLQVQRPPLSPPSLLFPIVWTILYFLMGVSSYLLLNQIISPKSEIQTKSALWIYGTQLAVNFFWPLIFFQMKQYLFAFFWLLLLIVLVIWMIRAFYLLKPTAAYLQIPYLIWILFAAYLNFGVYWLN